jgi:predicted RNase H-like nuclease (RuvC/YqgF family)
MQNARDLSAADESQNVYEMPALEADSTYQRLTAALSADATLGGGGPAVESVDFVRRRLTPAEREGLTQKSVVAVLEHLSFTSERLQNSMARVGYLECQVEVMQDTVRQMPELRQKAAKVILLERENSALSEVLEERNNQLRRREKQLESKDREIELLSKILQANKDHLARVEADLDKLEQKPWVRFFAWFTGDSLSGSK